MFFSNEIQSACALCPRQWWTVFLSSMRFIRTVTPCLVEIPAHGCESSVSWWVCRFGGEAQVPMSDYFGTKKEQSASMRSDHLTSAPIITASSSFNAHAVMIINLEILPPIDISACVSESKSLREHPLHLISLMIQSNRVNSWVTFETFNSLLSHAPHFRLQVEQLPLPVYLILSI